MDQENLPDRRIRLAKLLAQRGVASRRAAETMITNGLISVDGEVVTEVATMVDADEAKIRVDGRPLPKEPAKVYYVMYKPRGVLTARDDDKKRPSVMNYLERLDMKGVDPVGRLDFNTEGAVILTNDGDMAHKLTHPSAEVPKRYVVKCYRTPSESDLAAIERGIHTPEGKLKPAKARLLEQTDTENAWVEVTITQSGSRVVQQMFTQLGHPISKLRRESYATISVRDMERGAVRELTPQELTRLRDIADGVKPQRAGRNWRKPGFALPKAKKARIKRKPKF